MNNNFERFIAIKTEDGKIEEVMGKYVYISCYDLAKETSHRRSKRALYPTKFENINLC